MHQGLLSFIKPHEEKEYKSNSDMFDWLNWHIRMFDWKNTLIWLPAGLFGGRFAFAACVCCFVSVRAFPKQKAPFCYRLSLWEKNVKNRVKPQNWFSPVFLINSVGTAKACVRVWLYLCVFVCVCVCLCVVITLSTATWNPLNLHPVVYLPPSWLPD